MKKISSEEFIQYIRSWGFTYESDYGSAGRYIKRKNNNFIYVVINKDDSILVCCNNSDWTFEAGHQYDALKYIAHNDRFLSSGNFDTDGDKYVENEEPGQEIQQGNSKTTEPTINTSTLQKFITLTKRLNKQLFFKDNNGNLKRVAPSKYDSIKPEQLANVFVTKTGKEEMSLASIIPQLKQDNLIEQIEKLYEETINMNNLVEDRKDEQPSDMITTRRYRPLPLSYRDRLKDLGFESAGRVSKWFKEYKGYCITVIERTNRQKLVVFLSEGSVLKIDPTRGKKLVGEEVYTEEQLVNKIKEFESKIDTFRKDPYGRDEESIYEQMNNIDDEESL